MFKTILIVSSLLVLAVCNDFPVSNLEEYPSSRAEDTINEIVFVNLGTYTGAYDNGTFYQKTFLFSKHPASDWAGARTLCQSFNYELATFETFMESLWFLATADNNSYLRKFTALVIRIDGMAVESPTTTEWYWANTGDKATFPISWMPGQPNGVNDQYCLVIEKGGSQTKFLYNDLFCSYSCSFVCQKWNKF